MSRCERTGFRPSDCRARWPPKKCSATNYSQALPNGLHHAASNVPSYRPSRPSLALTRNLCDTPCSQMAAIWADVLCAGRVRPITPRAQSYPGLTRMHTRGTVQVVGCPARALRKVMQQCVSFSIVLASVLRPAAHRSPLLMVVALGPHLPRRRSSSSRRIHYEALFASGTLQARQAERRQIVVATTST